jgi:hypothetical protein
VDFGASDRSPSVYIAGTKCATLSWLSTTVLSCLTPNGSGKALMWLQVESATGSATFTYDSPVVTFTPAYNVPVLGRTTVYDQQLVLTAIGFNFGAADYSATSSLRSHPCQCSAWVSNTQLSCYTAAARFFTRELRMTVTLGELVGTGSLQFSYDAPVITAISRANIALTGAPLSVMGLNFAQSDWSQTVELARSVCVCTAWQTSTALKCDAPFALATAPYAVVTIGETTGTLAAGFKFSFDSPSLSSLTRPNIGRSGGGSITLYGLGFGGLDQTASAQLFQVAQCATASWLTATSMSCLVAPPDRQRRHVTLTIASVLVATGVFLHSFDAPVLTQAERNAPLSGSGSLTAYGMNFGVEVGLPSRNDSLFGYHTFRHCSLG